MKRTYKVLIGEMAKEKVTIEAISKLLAIHRNTVFCKLNKGAFYIEEAAQIQETFFPQHDLRELFRREE